MSLQENVLYLQPTRKMIMINANAVDLHVHSNHSDGTLSPTQLVDLSLEKGLRAFALTDHDTVAGLEEAICYGQALCQKGQQAPEIIPGIELSTQYNNKDIHILGLCIDYKNPTFQSRLDAFVDSRIKRNIKMCKLLQEHGITITYEQLLETFPNAVITRAHYAQFLLSNGYVKSVNEAFDRYIGDYASCFVPREKVTPAQTIDLILQADGIPVLAHPLLYHMGHERLDTLIGELKEAGLLGIEAIYSTHSTSDEREIRNLATKHHLLITGGSDYHGDNKPRLDLGVGYGNLFVSEEVLVQLKKSKQYLLFTDMDGTLLNDKCEISPTLKKGIDQLTEKGHHFILSSGRPLPSILEMREKLELLYPNMLVISNNGALIYDCDNKEQILAHKIAQDDIRYIIQEAENRELHIHGYTDTEIVCHEENDELRFYTNRIHLPLKCVDDIAASLENGTFKLQAIHLTDKTHLEAFRDHISPFCEGRVQMFFSNDQYLEILPAAADKGSALNFVQDYLYAPKSHTYAVGDAENDISMLKAAGTAVAMLNASDAVKETADRITQNDNNHDGLLDVIQEILS